MEIYDSVQVTKDFKRRTIVVEHNDRGHTELISLEFFQEHCKLVDTFKKGDRVTIDFNLKGRKWTNPDGVDKFFNTLQAWKIGLDTTVES